MINFLLDLYAKHIQKVLSQAMFLFDNFYY